MKFNDFGEIRPSMPKGYVVMCQFAKERGTSVHTLERYILQLSAEEEAEFGKVETFICGRYLTRCFSPSQIDFLNKHYPQFTYSNPPQGAISLDLFAIQNHSRARALLNYIDLMDDENKMRFGELKWYKDKTGGISRYITREQQEYLLRKAPTIAIKSAPEGYVSVTVYARQNRVGVPKIMNLIDNLTDYQRTAFGTVGRFKVKNGNIANYLSPKQQKILDDILKNEKNVNDRC